VCNELGLPGLVESCPEQDALFEVATTPTAAAAPTNGLAVQELDGGATDGEKAGEQERQPSQLARDLHRLLIETCIAEGKLVCANCGHEYAIKEGIANLV